MNATRLGVGAMLVALFGYAAAGGEPHAIGAVATSNANEICGYVVVNTPSGPERLSYSRRHRKLLLEEERKADFARAGVPWSQRSGYRLDHIVPLEIGGDDIPQNRQPEEVAEAKLKDEVENAVHDALCRKHSISAPAAQAIFLSGRWRDELWRVK